MINTNELTEEQELRWDIAQAKYLVHFREHFPVLSLFAWEVLTEEHVKQLEKIVDDCIADNKPCVESDDDIVF